MRLSKVPGDESKGILRRSRLVKAVADAGRVGSFEAGEERLRSVYVKIVVGPEAAATPAGMGAVITAARLCLKIFEHVEVTGAIDGSFELAIFGSEVKTLEAALLQIGRVDDSCTLTSTHRIVIGNELPADASSVRCWWDGWHAGVRRRHDMLPLGDGSNPLAGIFAGALAVREVFASRILSSELALRRTSIVSLWEPWSQENCPAQGPEYAMAATRLWLVGLGHLGQGIAWSLLSLPAAVGSTILLQDDQQVGVENEPTGILVEEDDIGHKKCRSVAKWFERAGWATFLVERRHHGEKAREDDPPLVICALDKPAPRRLVAGAGFPYCLDAGVGHGAAEFETFQFHCVRKDDDVAELWTHSGTDNTEAVLSNPAYRQARHDVGGCGMPDIAGAGVAAPFVGAAVGALMVAQAIRLYSAATTCRSFQLQLGAPDMATQGEIQSPYEAGLGGKRLKLRNLR